MHPKPQPNPSNRTPANLATPCGAKKAAKWGDTVEIPPKGQSPMQAPQSQRRPSPMSTSGTRTLKAFRKPAQTVSWGRLAGDLGSAQGRLGVRVCPKFI
mmetsp:Transcript_124594/g.215955  ORF Transcript_124594/g.215955 Transcript_124594/m.215955 type:complete len:99 (-) Transcript_124594:456-752(-)